MKLPLAEKISVEVPNLDNIFDHYYKKESKMEA